MREILINRRYKHFKGNEYKVICIAKDSETEESFVVYQALYGNHEIWIRSYDMFNSFVDKEKYPQVHQNYRFELIEDK